MNLVERFRKEWWEMEKIDYAREKLLNREHKEVTHEMVYQECQQGLKTLQQIADEYGLHKTTIYRIDQGKGLNK